MELSVLCSFFVMLFIFPLILNTSVQADNDEYDECKKAFLCGTSNVTLRYPFYDGRVRSSLCGYPGFSVDCSKSYPEFSMASETFYLLSMNETSDAITVILKSDYDGYCPDNLLNIDFKLYKYASANENITFYYDCPAGTIATLISCSNVSNNNDVMGYVVTQNFGSLQDANLNGTCLSSVVVPAQLQAGSQFDPSNVSFGLEWNAENKLCDGCRDSDGVCGSNEARTKFACYCSNGTHDSDCNGPTSHNSHNGQRTAGPTSHNSHNGQRTAGPTSHNSHNGQRTAGPTSHNSHNGYRTAGVTLACIITGLAMLALLSCYVKRRQATLLSCYVKRRQATENQDIDAFLKKHELLQTKIYTYRSLKQITNSFKDKLGEGGYGVVYKGKMLNGHLVAVKLLKESKGNVEEFMNEVTSIARTNHVNVVTLLGFCFEGRKRALVYDFMPNGSLEKFIYGNNNQKSLDWNKLFQIAVGIARGLEYLHRGCNTRIVHFDIKPHNILLDEELCPKISDFGLAKPFNLKESVISISGARGTVGFIAPEVFLDGFGGVSHKSDVYSYGMLVIDMVGCRKNVNAEVAESSEQYFPQWIYKQLEQTGEVVHQELLNGEEKGTFRKMILVSLWCIQTNPTNRPPMTRVVEMLEGPLEYLQVPPIPSLFTPPISQPIFSSKATMST